MDLFVGGEVAPCLAAPFGRKQNYSHSIHILPINVTYKREKQTLNKANKDREATLGTQDKTLKTTKGKI